MFVWVLLSLPMGAFAETSGGRSDLTLSSSFWVDSTGRAAIDEVSVQPGQRWEALGHYRNFDLGASALWLRIDPGILDANLRWYLVLSASAFVNDARLYSRRSDGTWDEQKAGDDLPVAQWAHPDQTPVFSLDTDHSGPVWLRVMNSPATTSPRLQVLSEQDLQSRRYTTFLLVGGYLGFGLLVLFLGWVHARMYQDRAFVAYCFYVAFMLGFQASFTGIAGLFFWPQWAAWNDMAPAFFMLWLTASGIWFVREACSVSRYNRTLDRLVVAWCLIGLIYPFIYVSLLSPVALALLNLYGLLSVVLSISLCLWTWRRGETYAGWLFLGFLPVHLAYPFPALRSAGLMSDGWAAQYAVLIGSAIEIPLLLYILHRRAKDYSENRARMRAMESTDPLTGLTIVPVLRLRLRDALRRSRRAKQQCGLLLVEVSNHQEIAQREGREAGDRALVVTASRLSSVVRDVDTVCRVSDNRFAMLIEGPQKSDLLKLVSQHAIAKGLERLPNLPSDVSLKLRLVSALVPSENSGPEELDEEALLARLNHELDRLVGDPRKVVRHFSSKPPTHA